MDLKNQINILKTLERNPTCSQRDLASGLGMSLGKANYCLKSLADKGFIKVRNFQNSQNKVKYAYLLTPQGVREKTKLTVQFLKHKTAEYQQLKLEIQHLKEAIGK
ncbi:MAG: MarR family EPS-associated transcriptional regulator [Candidatus Thioglobus sp.]|nr:MarR family EPS-associated transcriptional regulator [Candidatus Thioglobus sp.]